MNGTTSRTVLRLPLVFLQVLYTVLFSYHVPVMDLSKDEKVHK